MKSEIQKVIGGTPVTLTFELVPLEALKLDPENPRIRFQIAHGSYKSPLTQDQLLEVLGDQPRYGDLHRQIREQGSVHEALIVRYDGTIVEGNTRYTVAWALNKTKGAGDKWKRLPINRLPKDVPERVVQLLMADYHISRKTTWRAIAQADHIHRLVKEGVPLEQIALAVRSTVKWVEKELEAYRYLLDEVLPRAKTSSAKDRLTILESKFSHAREFVRRKDLEDARAKPALRATVAEAIAQGRIHGAEIRRLAHVLRHPKAVAVLVKKGFKDAVQVVHRVDPAAESRLVISMRKLATLIGASKPAEMDVFKTNRKAQTALLDLVAAIAVVKSFVPKKEAARARRS